MLRTWGAAVVLIVGAALIAAVAAAADAPPATCSINGWGEATDGAAIPVHDQPHAASRLVGTFPTDDDRPAALPSGEKKLRQLAEFSIFDGGSGWFRVGNARIVTLRDASWEKAASPLEGWIRGENIRFMIEDSKAYAKPDPGSKVRIAYPDAIFDRWFNLEDCRGKWAKLSVLPSHSNGRPGHQGKQIRPVTVWATHICGQAMTGCDYVPLVYGTPSRSGETVK